MAEREALPPSDYLSLAGEFKASQMWREAATLYMEVTNHEESNTADVWAELGKCRLEDGELELARETLEAGEERVFAAPES